MLGNDAPHTYGAGLFGSPANRETWAEREKRWAREDNEALGGVLLFVTAFASVCAGLFTLLVLLFG